MIYLTNIAQSHGWTVQPIGYNYKDDYEYGKFPSNITICTHKGSLITNIRYTNYAYVPMVCGSIPTYMADGTYFNQVKSINVISNISSGESISYILEGTGNTHMGDVSYKGLEDVRLVSWNDTLYGIGYRPDIMNGKVIPQLIEYNDDLTMHRSWFIYTGNTMEKNWQPIVDRPFTFIYDPETSATVTLDIDNLKESDDFKHSHIINEITVPKFSGTLRGSSQLIPMPDGGYISICHSSAGGKDVGGYTHWVYDHYFVLYDADLHMIGKSSVFHFVDDCIEFCCGMGKDDQNVYISYSLYDGCTHLISIPYEDFYQFIEGLMNDPDQYYTRPATDYMVDSYKNYDIRGHMGIIYQFYLEYNNRLSDPSNIITDLPELKYIGGYGEMMEKNILLYFITRNSNNQQLISYFKEKYQS